MPRIILLIVCVPAWSPVLPRRRSRQRIAWSFSYWTAHWMSFDCVMMKGSSTSVVSRSARIFSASSMCPCAISQRGLSGSHGTVPKRIKIKINWKASGKRHATLPPRNLASGSVPMNRVEPMNLRESVGDPIRQRKASDVHDHLDDD